MVPVSNSLYASSAFESGKVNAPLAVELPFSLECRLFQHHRLGLHTIFIGEIVGIQADEDVLGPLGLPDIEKTQAISWGGLGSNHYFAVGEKLAKAFSVEAISKTPSGSR